MVGRAFTTGLFGGDVGVRVGDRETERGLTDIRDRTTGDLDRLTFLFGEGDPDRLIFLFGEAEEDFQTVTE